MGGKKKQKEVEAWERVLVMFGLIKCVPRFSTYL